jgi:UDP-N-acetylmuramoyl-tripeptide--D-alanyl-D-alanine ligase
VKQSEVSLDVLLGATGGNAWRAEARHFTGVAIDGRRVPRGGLWFAIRGERHDGHDFAAQAIGSGAAGLVVERGRAARLDLPASVTVVEVDDTVQALGRLGRAHRLGLRDLTVVGVTGSNGKTTTKEMIASILAQAQGAAAVHKTSGNFNNHLGLPLTLLALHEGHRYAVIEMGMSGLGEIAYLAELARPRVGVIVNVGPVHLAQLGSLDNVARAKGELFAALPPDGVAVFPAGDERIAAQARASAAACQLRFGAQPGVAVRRLAAHVEGDGTVVELRLPDGAHVQTKLQALGEHNAHNAAAAAAVGYALGVTPAAIAAGLAAATTEKHRSSLVVVGGRRILDDCYNASPLSMPAGLDTLVSLRASGRAVAVLGDMLELGPEAAALHRQVGEHAARTGVDLLLATGPHAGDMVAGARDAGLASARAIGDRDADVEALVAALLRETAPGDAVLVKASRGMHLERVIDALRAALEPAARQAGGER